jgi:hypothetical protein
MDNKYDAKVLTGFVGFGYCPMVGLCEQSNEFFSYKGGRRFE